MAICTKCHRRKSQFVKSGFLEPEPEGVVAKQKAKKKVTTKEVMDGGKVDIHKAFDWLPELHLRTLPTKENPLGKKYNYVGPFTKYHERLNSIERLNSNDPKRYLPINMLDALTMYHDHEYSKGGFPLIAEITRRQFFQ